MLRHLALIAAVVASAVVPASAQLPGNASLKGVYNVRYLGVKTTTTNVALSFQGQITFDGNGGYTVTGQGASAEGTFRFRPSGTYTVISSGMMYMDDPFDAVNKSSIYGAIGANGALLGSATDAPQDTFCDLFMAVPAAATASLSILNGAYRVAHLEFLAGDTRGGTRNTFFTMNANGAGSLGDVTISGTAQSLNSRATTQTSPGATYTMTATGAGTLVLPPPAGTTAANTLLSGTKVLFVSQDGNLFIAGSQSGYDMEVGIKTSTAAIDGFFWEGYLQNYLLGSSVDGVWSGSGSAKEIGSSKLEIYHERTCSELYLYCFDWTGGGGVNFDAQGLSISSTKSVGIGANGAMLVGAGGGGNYQLQVYLKAPTMTPPAGATVFLDPQGVVNAGSFAPVTAQLAPGEMISLFGTNIGPATPVSASAPFQTTLGGVQVRINNTPVPVYSAKSDQVNLIVPYNVDYDPSNGFVNIQVVNNNVASNTVSVYLGLTSPGVFTYYASAAAPFSVAAIKYTPDASIVTPANPAKAGDIVALYLSGLGEVSPALAAGSLIPSGTVSKITDQYFYVEVGGVKAEVQFAGLALFSGCYQVNIKVPAGVTAGNADVYIETADGTSLQATLPIAQ